MERIKSVVYASITLLFVFICFVISSVMFFGPITLVYSILETIGLVRKGTSKDLIIAWDQVTNVMVGGDEQIRVSDRVYYWSSLGCLEATIMRKVIDAIFYLIDGPEHCKKSFESNAVCASGWVIPRPFPLFHVDGCEHQ